MVSPPHFDHEKLAEQILAGTLRLDELVRTIQAALPVRRLRANWLRQPLLCERCCLFFGLYDGGLGLG